MRIGIVSATAGAGHALQAAVDSRPRREVVWTAVTASSGVEACVAVTPDLVILDLRLNGLDGVDATRQIMAASPCPILLVTHSLHLTAAAVYDAVGLGALDAVEIPWFDRSPSAACVAPLLAKIDTIARLTGRGSRARRAPGGTVDEHVAANETLVVIGASAGGPAAVSMVLAALPADLPAAVVIVQHVGEQFMPAMVQWLDQHAPGRVVLAPEGERPSRGRVSMAGAGGHLSLGADQRFVYTQEAQDAAYQPSVDVFFESVSRFWTGPVLGVLLTGMGRDGAAGLKALRDRGHHTIAQDQATCVVYGMPKAAAALDAAVEILPLAEIGARLLQKVQELSSASDARR